MALSNVVTNELSLCNGEEGESSESSSAEHFYQSKDERDSTGEDEDLRTIAS